MKNKTLLNAENYVYHIMIHIKNILIRKYIKYKKGENYNE